MPKSLSNAALEAYRNDGSYFPLAALSSNEVAHVRTCLEEHETKTGGPLQGNFRHKAHLLFTWVDELVHHPKIVDAAEDVLGPNLLCWTTNFFIKEANSAGFVSWHQDAFYWGLNKDTVMTAWVALTPANLKNGCMKFLPGSQTEDHLQHVDTFHKDNLLSRGQEIAVKVDTDNTVDCILNPGEMSLHHVKLVHGSEPNRSNDRRIGLAIRYIPTDVRQLKVRDSATLVRGVDRDGNFDHEPRPRRDLDENALAAHADAVGRQVKALYSGTDKQEFRA
jgi:ectoine hydroxylase-related dioxygenase (phytanoyl-CoA dioxygenase family)